MHDADRHVFDKNSWGRLDCPAGIRLVVAVADEATAQLVREAAGAGEPYGWGEPGRFAADPGPDGIARVMSTRAYQDLIGLASDLMIFDPQVADEEAWDVLCDYLSQCGPTSQRLLLLRPLPLPPDLPPENVTVAVAPAQLTAEFVRQQILPDARRGDLYGSYSPEAEVIVTSPDQQQTPDVAAVMRELDDQLWELCWQPVAGSLEEQERWEANRYDWYLECAKLVQPLPAALDGLVEGAVRMWLDAEHELLSRLGDMSREKFLNLFEEIRAAAVDDQTYHPAVGRYGPFCINYVVEIDWLSAFAWQLPHADPTNAERYHSIAQLMAAAKLTEELWRERADAPDGAPGLEKTTFKKLDALYRLAIGNEALDGQRDDRRSNNIGGTA